MSLKKLKIHNHRLCEKSASTHLKIIVDLATLRLISELLYLLATYLRKIVDLQNNIAAFRTGFIQAHGTINVFHTTPLVDK